MAKDTPLRMRLLTYRRSWGGALLVANGAIFLFTVQAQAWANSHLFGHDHGTYFGPVLVSSCIVLIAGVAGARYISRHPHSVQNTRSLEPPDGSQPAHRSQPQLVGRKPPNWRLTLGIEVALLFAMPAFGWSWRLLTMVCQRC